MCTAQACMHFFCMAPLLLPVDALVDLTTQMPCCCSIAAACSSADHVLSGVL
jgi:hypothetical protein